MNSICEARNLYKSYQVKKDKLFSIKRDYIEAVDDVSFTIKKGETFGIVGESGSGKTTIARLLLRLIEPTKGKIFFRDKDITLLSGREMKPLRRKMQMIFQDPYSSLNPRKNILSIIAEPLKVHKINKNGNLLDTIKKTLDLVNLPDTDIFLKKIPDELSGGQRQRVGIARALVLNPEFIIADEPVSMLDASVKAGIISLLMELKNKIDLTYIFITHEIALAYYICDNIAVMYKGRVVERGPAKNIIERPIHPYTKLLIDAVPPLLPDEDWKNREIKQESFSEKTEGCGFFFRCENETDKCKSNRPELTERKKNHYVACFQK